MGGIVTVLLGRRPEALIFAGSLFWALALTGLPLAGRPAPLVSTVLAFVGTHALRRWRRTKELAGGGASVPESSAAGQGPRPMDHTPLFLVGWLAWACGLGGTAILLLAWMGRLQMFPALDAALASTQIGAAAGLTLVLGSELARTGRRLVLVPLGMSIASLSVLFWWFVLSA